VRRLALWPTDWQARGRGFLLRSAHRTPGPWEKEIPGNSRIFWALCNCYVILMILFASAEIMKVVPVPVPLDCFCEELSCGRSIRYIYIKNISLLM
jgi:hypothetical protein